MVRTLAMRMTLAAALLLALATFATAPRGVEALRLIAAADDPVRLAEIGLERAFHEKAAAGEIDAALAEADPELAESLVALADERGIAVAPEQRRAVEAAATAAASPLRTAGRFVEGFIVGEPDGFAGLAGTVAGDLFVYGDIRDVVRETANFARGQEVDELILGLAGVGLAITAGTYATLGAGAPARVGVSIVKAAGKAGRMSTRLTRSLLRPLRAAVDPKALRAALGPGAWLRPVAAVRGARSAVKVEKATGVVRVVGDVGRISGKAGTRAALDGLKIADSPKDVARLARLADSAGGRTRAVIKVLGRGAIALTVGLFELASWMFWALLSLLGFVVSLKRTVERMTERAIQRGKLRRARREARALAMAAA